MKTALTIAGSDSIGGAGIQADLKTFTALSIHGCCIITSVTAQNTSKVIAIHDVPASVIKSQIDAVFSDVKIDSVKVGMSSNAGITKAVAFSLKKNKAKNIVLDPVMVSGTGSRLLEKNAVSVLKKELIPLADIVTPNIDEAEALCGVKVRGNNDAIMAAKEVMKLGCKSVLIKGGHLKGNNVVDLFYDGKTFCTFIHRRINRKFHGTGCVLSSAIAGNLAKGFTRKESVAKSIYFLNGRLKTSYRVGSKYLP